MSASPLRRRGPLSLISLPLLCGRVHVQEAAVAAQAAAAVPPAVHTDLLRGMRARILRLCAHTRLTDSLASLTQVAGEASDLEKGFQELLGSIQREVGMRVVPRGTEGPLGMGSMSAPSLLRPSPTETV